jgi:hypothetical protein
VSPYAPFDSCRLNWPRSMRCALLTFTRARVRSLITPCANISFIGVQYVSIQHGNARYSGLAVRLL